MTDVPLLMGNVFDSAGRPIQGARVAFTQSPAAVPDIALLTGADGKFVLTAPTPGWYRLGVSVGEAFQEQDVDVPENGAIGIRVTI